MKKDITKLRTIDLFAGIGGIRKGFEKAGFRTVYAEDSDRHCKVTYDLNSSDIKLTVADISNTSKDTNFLNDKFEILLGGFPCQAFSVAGYRHGFQDSKGRGNLFFKMADIIDDRKPVGFMLENVKNLRGHDDKKTFQVIKDTLDKLGYEISDEILNTMEYGNLPQNRERIYIVGFRKELNILKYFQWPKKKELSKTVADILDAPNTISDKYYYNDKPLWEKIKNYPFKIGEVYQWRRKYIRVNKKNVIPTLTANMGMGGHNVPIIKDARGVRKLTPIECFRAQGFDDIILPDGIGDAQLYKQAGNSVSVSVVEEVAKQMKLAIMSSNVSKKSNPAKSRRLRQPA